jgi:hypothetical protein
MRINYIDGEWRFDLRRFHDTHTYRSVVGVLLGVFFGKNRTA